MQLMQTHVESGYEILKDIPFPWPIAQTVYQHHERLDGSGYPNGLKEEEICVQAKIMAVADTIEAISTMRPYRAGLGLPAAMEEIAKEAGAKLDTKVVEAALEIYRSSDELENLIGPQ